MLSLGISCWHSATAAADAKIEYVVRSGRKAQNTWSNSATNSVVISKR